MTFYDRYSKVCADHQIDPCSQRAAEMIGVTRGTISAWGSKGTQPKADTIQAIADAFGVSGDYLLGRTEDPTDYTNPDLIASISSTVLDQFNGDVRKAVEFQRAVADDVAREQMPDILKRYSLLDEIDRAKVDAYMHGLLSADKYRRHP